MFYSIKQKEKSYVDDVQKQSYFKIKNIKTNKQKHIAQSWTYGLVTEMLALQAQRPEFKFPAHTQKSDIATCTSHTTVEVVDTDL